MQASFHGQTKFAGRHGQLCVITSYSIHYTKLYDGSYFYFVHSYALEVTDATLATCDYGGLFTAVVGKDNFFGAQFHPERSGKAGARMIQNFLEL